MLNPTVMLFVDGSRRFTIFKHLGIEMTLVNAEILNGNAPISLFNEFISGGGPVVFVLLAALCITSMRLVLYVAKSKASSVRHNYALILAEIFAVSIFLVPALLPFRAARFVCGLLSFSLFMSLHSKVVSKLEPNGDLISHVLNALTFNTKEFMTISMESRLPSTLTFMRYMTLLALLDGCTYLICEFIPFNISSVSAASATSLATGFWAYFSLEFNYTQSRILCGLFGYQLPLNLTHKNPFMSISLSEFWGVRWNPIICKLLQTSFYKPFRKMGIARAICVISCFIGSGLLHAIPIFFSDHNMKDTLLMGGFFVVQGILVLSEQIFFSMMGWNDKSTHSQSTQVTAVEGSDTDAKAFFELLPYIGEGFQMLGAFGLFYCFSEGKSSLKQLSIPISLLIGSLCVMLAVQLPKVLDQYPVIDVSDAPVPMSLQSTSIEITTVEDVPEKNPVPSSTSCKSVASMDSYTSVADIGNFSQMTSRNASFTSSEKLLETSSQELLQLASNALLDESVGGLERKVPDKRSFPKNNRKRLIALSIWIICGWLWTVGSIALVLPMFAIPVHNVMSNLYHQSIFFGPVVRSMQYVGWF